MRKTEIFEVQSDSKLVYSAGLASILTPGNLGFWVVGIRFEFEVAKTDGGGPVAYQDWLARVATGLVVSGGNRTYISNKTRDLRTLYWWNRMRMAGGERMPDFETGSQTFYWPVTILFTPDPLKFDDQPNLWPVMAGIAPDNNLTIEIDWAASGALGSNITIGAGTMCRVTYLGTFPGNSVPKMQPNYQSTIVSPPSVLTGLQQTFDMPVGPVYRRTAQIFINGTTPNDVRLDGTAGNAISEAGIGGIAAADQFKLKVRTWAKQSQTDFEVADDNTGVPGAAALYGAATTKVQHNPGVTYIDWAQFIDSDDASTGNDPTWGLNLGTAPSTGQPKTQGAARLLYSVDAFNGSNVGPNVLVFNEGYLKYPWAS